MKDNSRASQLEVIRRLRFPMIVLVTYAHSYGHVADGFSLLYSDWNTYEFLKLLVSQTLVKVVVPVFFIISGYLFFYNMQSWDQNVYFDKLKRRVKTLLIPYVLWNLIMALKLKLFSWHLFWDQISEAGMQTDWFGVAHYLVAPANLPLWFLRDLMVVSLLAPVIFFFLRKMGYWMLVFLGIYYLSGVCPFLPGLSAYALFFFTMGACLSVKKADVQLGCRRLLIPSCILSVILATAMMCTYHSAVFSSLMLGFRLTGAVAVFCLAQHSCCAHKQKLNGRLSLSDSAYFIYLAHYVFFFAFIDEAFFRVVGESITALSAHYLLAPLIKAAILAGIYTVYRFVRDR